MYYSTAIKQFSSMVISTKQNIQMAKKKKNMKQGMMELLTDCI